MWRCGGERRVYSRIAKLSIVRPLNELATLPNIAMSPPVRTKTKPIAGLAPNCARLKKLYAETPMATRAKEIAAMLANNDKQPLRQTPTAATRMPTTPVISVKKPSCSSAVISVPGNEAQGRNDPAMMSVKPRPVRQKRKAA